MKRSTTVTLTILSGVATSVLAACGNDTRRCVDPADRVVAEDLCGRGSGTMVGGAWYPYRYYYGGAGFAGIGSRMRGGSYSVPRSGGVHVGGTSRGGFGGIGRGFGGSGA